MPEMTPALLAYILLALAALSFAWWIIAPQFRAFDRDVRVTDVHGNAETYRGAPPCGPHVKAFAANGPISRGQLVGISLGPVADDEPDHQPRIHFVRRDVSGVPVECTPYVAPALHDDAECDECGGEEGEAHVCGPAHYRDVFDEVTEVRS